MCRSTSKDVGNQPQPRTSHPGKSPTPRSGKPESRGGHQKRSSTVHHVANQNDSSSDDEYVYSVATQKKQPRTTVHIASTPIEVIIDSGASQNLLDSTAYHKFHPSPHLIPVKTKLFSYGASKPLSLKGSFTAPISHETTQVDADFVVVAGNHGSLLSFETAKDLGLLEVIQEVTTPPDNHLIDELLSTYNVTDGIGKLKDHQVKLHVDTDVKPIAQPHRRIPFHTRKALEKELDSLQQQDIIEPVTGPTPWVSPVVCVPKPHDPTAIRVCVDMRRANTAIQRERHLTPTVDDIIHDLNDAKVFSKIDLRSGYHQLELHPDSRPITTFSTHKGLYRYKRLSFGVCSASEVFQSVIQQTLSDITGVRNFSDDIIVFGTNQADHDAALTKVIKRLHDKGLTINRQKCAFNQTKLNFFGYIFSSEGMSADPKKVSAITSAKAPENASEVRSFLGMTNYLARFIPNYADLTTPLRELTKKDTPWNWTSIHEESFQRLKEALSTSGTMSYFDQDKDTYLVVDASPHGLGAILCQAPPGNPDNTTVIAYGSRCPNRRGKSILAD